LQEGDRLEIGSYLFEVAVGAFGLSHQGLSLEADAQISADSTVRDKLQMPALAAERHLLTLLNLCFWMADGANEAVLRNQGLPLLLEGFQVAEVHYYDANGALLGHLNRSGLAKQECKIGAFLASKFAAHSHATCFKGEEIARLQKGQRGLERFHYLVGPLRQDATNSGHWLLLVRPAEWQPFGPHERTLFQAICQLWHRSMERTQTIARLVKENDRMRHQTEGGVIVGDSRVMKMIRERILRWHDSRYSVLILGERGSGKEVIAQFIHQNCNRRSGNFVPVNCAAIPKELVESTLFGHKIGGFTGAAADKEGKFKTADNGTLFLDEVGDLPLPVQASLLRALETGEIEPVGSDQSVKVDVRIIAATNQLLEAMVARGDFRADLFDRLKGFVLRVPPLREHLEDLPSLVSFFSEKLCSAEGRAETEFSPAAIARLLAHDWPGNVRELRNVVNRCIVEAIAPPVVTVDDVERALRE